MDRLLKRMPQISWSFLLRFISKFRIHKKIKNLKDTKLERVRLRPRQQQEMLHLPTMHSGLEFQKISKN